jgi:EpsI family protein
MTSLLQNKFVRIFTVILLLQAGLFYSASRGESAPFAAPLVNFPSTVGPWTLAQEGVIEKEELDILKADDTLTRWYTEPGGGANLFIAFFKTQRTGQSPHSPKNCLPGSGWQPSESGRVDVTLPDSSSIHINRYVVAKGDSQSLVLYWYQSQGRVIADEFAAKFFLISDSIRKHRSDTALVRVVVPIPPGRIALADKVGTEFVQAMYPVVRNYLPH